MRQVKEGEDEGQDAENLIKNKSHRVIDRSAGDIIRKVVEFNVNSVL